MKGVGPRNERETVIRFDEDSDQANVWTASKPVFNRLKRLGFAPHEDTDHSASFRLPKKSVSFRRVRGRGASAGTAAQATTPED